MLFVFLKFDDVNFHKLFSFYIDTDGPLVWPINITHLQFLRDDTHITSMKIIQFLRPSPNPPCPSTSKLLHLVDLGRPFPNEILLPPSYTHTHTHTHTHSSNDNQLLKRKHNPRMTIMCYQLINLVWLSFPFYPFTVINIFKKY